MTENVARSGKFVEFFKEKKSRFLCVHRPKKFSKLKNLVLRKNP